MKRTKLGYKIVEDTKYCYWCGRDSMFPKQNKEDIKFYECIRCGSRSIEG